MGPAGVDDVFVSRGRGVRGARHYALDTPGSFRLLGTYSSPVVCPNHHNELAVVEDRWLLLGCAEDGSPIEVVSISTMTQAQSIDMDNGGLSGFWAGAVSSDGRRVFQGGWVAAFLEHVPGAEPEIQLRHRFDHEGAYRGAVFVDDGRPLLLAGGGDAAGAFVDIYDATDLAAPRLLSRTSIPFASFGSVYDLDVDVASRRAFLAGNRGEVAIIDLDALPPTTTTWPTF